MLTIAEYHELGLALRQAQTAGNHHEAQRIKHLLAEAPRAIRRVYLGEIASRGYIEDRPIRPGFLEELLTRAGPSFSAPPARAAAHAHRAAGTLAMRVCMWCRRLLSADATECPDDGADVHSVITLPRDTRIGAYRIERLLGDGDMGFVYEATHELSNRRVAIKMLRPELAKHEQVVARFLNEAKAVSLIDHQNIVGVYDYGDSIDGSVYFVMEFLEGETLDEVMGQHRPMQLPLVLHVFGQIGKALAAAHAKQVVHRELKPSNVYVVSRANNPYYIKLLGFGIAQLRGAGAVQGLTLEGSVIGTTQYMSPEQISGRPVDARCDVWAMGVMLYRATTGQMPFKGDEFPRLADQILHHTPVPAGELAALPAAISALIASCLERAREDRCASISALLDGFERVKRECNLDDDAILAAVTLESTGVDLKPCRRHQHGTVAWAGSRHELTPHSIMNAEEHNVAVRPKLGSRGKPSPVRRLTDRLALWHWLVGAVVIALVIAELCSREPEIEACVSAQRLSNPAAAELCEQAWQDTRDEVAAVSGAFDALRKKDDVALHRWALRAPMTLEGARILHLWGQRQLDRGDLTGAETTLRQVLALRVDRDPLRAANTAYSLLMLVRSSQPVEESIKLARLAWDQAGRGNHPLPRAYAASALVDLLIDLGELNAADAVIGRMDPKDSRALKAFAEGSLRAAQGRTELAVSLLGRAYDINPADMSSWGQLDARVPLAQALLDLGQIAAARSAVEGAFESKQHTGRGAIDLQAQLTAVEAEVLLAEGQIDAALDRVERGLAMSSRDSARVRLLNVRGDALSQRGDVTGAERTWRDAADTVESWRASIPSSELRSGLLAHHRHALEALLESTAKRGDVAGALDATRRMVGRGLLDRLRQREVGAGPDADTAGAPPTGRARAPADADATIDNVMHRLDAQRERAATIATAPELIQATHDMVAIMSGARSIWAIRRRHGLWSIDRVGERASIVGLVDAYRRAIDDPEIADSLGDALFPLGSVPTAGAPLVVLVDRELADVPLAGLRVGGRYLVEHAPILELLAPDLLFAPVRERTWDQAVVLGDPGGDLASAAAEVGDVARALDVEPRRGNQATRDALANAATARVLHIAAHATVGNGEAGLVLADGTVSSLDIVRQRIAPRLAVIATCRSQVDDDPATSLVAAFLAAGATGVVGVKRALDDIAGAELMREFYRAGGADDPMRALAAAQRAAIARHHPPHSWAAVSFFGVSSWISNEE